MGLYESKDEPGLFFEIVAYATEAGYATDQERVEKDPTMRSILSRWRALLDGAVEVRRLEPVEIMTGSASPLSLEIDDHAHNDHDQVAALLKESELPVPDADDPPVHLLVVRGEGRIVACAGWERYRSQALVRSVAVRASSRRNGVGRALVERICERLAQGGVSDAYLLTKTAEPFFAQLGFSRIDRGVVPDPIRSSREFSMDCCAKAICMRRSLR
jgi:amino-acid N-acetyltransferase